MGASCAPSVANIYMGEFERRHIYNEVAPFYENINRCCRFIDDIFFIWEGEETTLQEFIMWLNLSDTNLKFTANLSTTRVEFLDIVVFSGDRSLLVSFYRKPTAKNTILCHDSYHPNSQKDSIPFGEFLRIRRNCSNIKEYDYHGELLKKKTSR